MGPDILAGVHAGPHPVTGVVVVAAGPTTEPAPALRVGDRTVIAADGGAIRARRWGWPVHHVVGDLDSIDDATLAACRRDGARIHRHPTAKDATDLELALDLALDEQAAEATVVLDGGGRVDHLLSSVLLLAADRYAPMRISGTVGASRFTVVRGRRELSGEAGDTVSLLAVGGPARVHTQGLVFGLDDEWLASRSARGVSNELIDERAQVSVTEGVVVVLQP